MNDVSSEYSSIDDLVDMMDADVHSRLRTAVELGRWPEGQRLTPEQLEHSMQAVIAYEARHFSEKDRTGYIDRSGLQTSSCSDTSPDRDGVDPAAPRDLKWVRERNQ